VKITLLSDEALRFDATPGPLTIEAPTAEQSYSPFHMLGSSLAVCTHSVLHSWASHAGLGADDLAVEVRWTFAERPHRVDSMEVMLEWPSLPESRREAAKRAAKLCTVHATLSTPPSLTTTLRTSADAVPAGVAG
jgi:putative redox protein